jgi:fatty acid desaturase
LIDKTLPNALYPLTKPKESQVSYEFYKFIHLAGVMLVAASLGGLFLHMARGGSKKYKEKKIISTLHGVGVLILLIAGFGMIAKGKFGFPPWVIVKMVIWLAIGMSPVLYYKNRISPGKLSALLLVLGLSAALLGVFKPF